MSLFGANKSIEHSVNWTRQLIFGFHHFAFFSIGFGRNYQNIHKRKSAKKANQKKKNRKTNYSERHFECEICGAVQCSELHES